MGFSPWSSTLRLSSGEKSLGNGNPEFLFFIKIAPENPVLWTGIKGASAKGKKKVNQMLKRVQTL